jgi:hypothetical protein
MDIEATLEDLEAQGYFQTITAEPKAPATAKAVRISFSDKDETSLVLTAPIQGQDFIAGFISNYELVQWLIIPSSSIHAISAMQVTASPLQTELRFFDLVTEKLIGIDLRIKFLKQFPEVSGKLKYIQGEWLTVESLTTVQVPISAIGYVAVEKLSELL